MSSSTPSSTTSLPTRPGSTDGPEATGSESEWERAVEPSSDGLTGEEGLPDTPIPDNVERIQVDLGERTVKLSYLDIGRDGGEMWTTHFLPLPVELRLLADMYEITDGECDTWLIDRQTTMEVNWRWSALGDWGNFGFGATVQDAMRDAMVTLQTGEEVNCGMCGGTGARFIGPEYDAWADEDCPACNGTGHTFIPTR